MFDEINYDRRHFLGTALMSIAAAELALFASANAQSSGVNSIANKSFAPLKQIDAGVLNVGYAESGPSDGRPVILLHGWPYDI